MGRGGGKGKGRGRPRSEIPSRRIILRVQVWSITCNPARDRALKGSRAFTVTYEYDIIRGALTGDLAGVRYGDSRGGSGEEEALP